VGLEVAKEAADVLVSRVPFQDAVGQPDEGAVVDQGEDAERAVVQLIDSDVAAEVLQAAGEVVGLDAAGRLFPPASTQFWMVAQGTKTR
jgi:hypothetical protein